MSDSEHEPRSASQLGAGANPSAGASVPPPDPSNSSNNTARPTAPTEPTITMASVTMENLVQGLTYEFQRNREAREATKKKRKVNKPDVFDGSDPRKLNSFLTQCLL